MMEFLLGGAAGGLLGLIGSYFTKLEERKILSIRMEHELKMADISLREMELAGQQAVSVAEVEGELAGWGKSLESTDRWGIGEASKAIVRPLITLYFISVTSYLAIEVWIAVNGIAGISPDALMDLVKQMITQLLFLTVTCTTWWFGARASGHPPMGAVGKR